MIVIYINMVVDALGIMTHMCELFAMSSRHPATVNVALEEFAAHGGQTDHHKDGWGIGYYQGRDAMLMREAMPAADSAQMEFIRHQDFSSTDVISHIRSANRGDIALRNTQPFSRELAGRVHLFAHNGFMASIEDRFPKLDGRYCPIGETDSEYAFCLLLDRLSVIWKDVRAMPSVQQRVDILSEFSRDMAELGPANFIYSDSDVIIAHGDVRQNPGGVSPPGLYSLCRTCVFEPKPIDVPGLTISSNADSQEIVLLASVPLSDEAWIPFVKGELLVLKNGSIVEECAV